VRAFDAAEIEIDEASIIAFFDGRARRCDPATSPNVTMLQDGNEALAQRRSQIEIDAIREAMADLGLHRPSTLDVGCGSGRLYFGLRNVLGDYLGIDGAVALIDSARQRLEVERKPSDPEAVFLSGALGEAPPNAGDSSHAYRLVLMSGILAYLNDRSLASLFASLRQSTQPGAVLIIREPLGIEARLTLKEDWSQALAASYNAIYRTCGEIETIARQTFGERLQDFRFRWLYEDAALNNRLETRQAFITVRLA
jgi:SAM-dependent methyltransferase